MDVAQLKECLPGVLVRVSIAVRRHLYRGKTFHWGCLTVWRFSQYHHAGTRQHAGRHGAGEVADSSTSVSRKQSEVNVSLNLVWAPAFETSKSAH